MPINLEDKICHKNNTLCDGHNHIKQIWPLELNFWVVTNDIKEELQHFVAFGKIKTNLYFSFFTSHYKIKNKLHYEDKQNQTCQNNLQNKAHFLLNYSTWK